MRILWLSHLIPYPPKGGVLQRSYNLIKETSKYHEVTLLAFNQSALLEAMFPSVSDGLAEAREHLIEFCERVEFFDIPSEQSINGKYILALKSLFSPIPFSINWLISNKMSAKIEAVLSEKAFDLIHFDTISLAPYLIQFGELPKVLDHHNIESHMMLRRSEKESNLLKKFYYYQEGVKLLRYEKQVCNKFDLHITCSELDSRRLKNIDPELHIDEIPNGVNIDYFSPESEKEIGNQLIFAGGLNWYPNKEAMIFFAAEVWPILKRKCPGVKMDVIGKNPPNELLKLNSHDPEFRVHGFVDDVRIYLARAGVYVCPIRDGGGTKLKLLDAFAMGKAVVAHPTACEGLDVINNENVLFAETAEEFAQKIGFLIESCDIRRSLGLNARKLVEDKYSFAEIGRRLSSDYESIAQRLDS